MTRRERLARKLDKRTEWAGKAEAHAEARVDAAHKLAERIPLGQPILVGHHSEGRARRDADKIHSDMTAGCEEARLANHHRDAARGLAIALDRSVFSDDDDAIARLEVRIAEREAEAELAVALNRAWRNGGAEAVRAAFGDEPAETVAETMRLAPWLRSPMDTMNLRASIRRDRERIEQIKTQQARAATAEASGGVTIRRIADDYVSITFAAKPAREVLGALRAAGFRWSGGSWLGGASKVPIDARGELLQRSTPR